ncbi:MAG: sigma 54-interacting transcriptional regulator [Desulfobacteraceae bacterium]|jgi:chemotaxis protein methyltransferase CheR|nr:sigma 54-interacting transcriptional regulator [Desulfobacteraceae bacterium]
MPEKKEFEKLKSTNAKLRHEITELKRFNDLLAAEKKILDEILDNLPGTFYIWDDRPQLIRWNKRHDEITEYSADDYVNMVPTDFFDEDEHQKVTAAVEKIFAEGEVTVEATLVTKSGKKIPHVYTAVRTKMGDKPVLMGFAIDITERKKAEKQLRDALTEVEALRNQLEADCTYLGEEIKLMHDYGNIIGESEVFKYVLFSLEQIAPTDTTVLILGESGTGKELIARALHSRSRRKERPLIKVDCAGLPANLIESELFGHEKGAYTGAIEKRIGRFELADGATIFLDEIGDLPLVLQQKLLRVLQDGEFERLGSSQVKHTDVRVIAATNRNLKNDVSKGRFRDDLWYRLNVFPLSIPPLRERAEDIPLLVNWTIKRLQRRLGKHIKTVPSSVMDDLKAYPWPGNVRELENVIERAVIVTPGNMLQLAAPLESPTSTSGNPPDAPIKILSEMEKEYILQALSKTNWNISGSGGAAELLGLNSSTLRGRMRKHDIRRPKNEPLRGNPRGSV